MEVKGLFCAALLLLLSGARAKEESVVVKKGGKMALEPLVSVKITNILWKHNGNLLAEWVEGVVELTYYASFKNRTTLDTITGRLEVTDMSRADVGAYTLEINNKVQDQSYRVSVYTEVPQPEVWIQPLVCTRESPSCTLLCEARTPGGDPEDTKEAEPISYSWSRDGDMWRPKGKKLNISKDTADTETFSCQMKNAVSEKASKPIKNPFYKPTPEPEPSPVGVIVGVLFGILGLAGLGIGGVFFYIKQKNAAETNTNPENGGVASHDGPATTTVYELVNQKTEDERSGKDAA